MNNSVKFRAVQNPVNHHITIEVYRHLSEKDAKIEWVMTDRFNELSASELKLLENYIHGLFKNNQKH
jgi:phage pi2 protein 07